MERREQTYPFNKPKYVYLNTFELGTQVFKDFTGEDIDRYMIARVLEYVLNSGKINGTNWISDIVSKVENFCRKENILTWKEALDVLINSQFIKQFRVPVEVLRKEEESMLREYKELIAELDSMRNEQ